MSEIIYINKKLKIMSVKIRYVPKYTNTFYSLLENVITIVITYLKLTIKIVVNVSNFLGIYLCKY